MNGWYPTTRVAESKCCGVWIFQQRPHQKLAQYFKIIWTMGIFVLAEVGYLFCLSVKGLTPSLSIKSIKWVVRYFVNRQTHAVTWSPAFYFQQSIINVWSRCCDLLKKKYKTGLLIFKIFIFRKQTTKQNLKDKKSWIVDWTIVNSLRCWELEWVFWW